MSMLTRCLSIVGALLLVVAGISAQSPVTVGNVVQGSGTIQAIDTTSRTITVRNEKGEEDSFVAGPQMTRFSELKVGDKINLTYYESTVYQVQPPGAAPAAAGTSGVTTTRATGDVPSATAARQKVSTVTVKAIDTKVPSVTVTTADGRTVTRKVNDRKNLEGIKAGDRIDITYTEALLASVEPAK